MKARYFGPALRATITAAMLYGAIAAAPAADRVEYWLINGPEYRQVSAAEFNDERSSCLRIVRRRYAEDHVTQWHCYL